MTLIHGDCLKAMWEMEKGSVDLVVTDPAYRTISGGTGDGPGRPSGMLKKNDGKIFEHNNLEIVDWMSLLYKVLRDDAHCYVMTNKLNLVEMLNVSQAVGFKLHNLLVWRKQNVTPSRWYMKNCEYTLFLRKGKAFAVNNPGSKTCHDFNNPVGNKVHPTEKPVDLMEFYVLNSSQPGEVVLDPFMGSGAVGLVCVNTDRKFLGIEVDEEYYNISVKRISKAQILKRDQENRSAQSNIG